MKYIMHTATMHDIAHTDGASGFGGRKISMPQFMKKDEGTQQYLI